MMRNGFFLRASHDRSYAKSKFSERLQEWVGRVPEDTSKDRFFFCNWSYAGSGLPQGPFWKTISSPLKLGKKWGFRENPEMGLKWVEKWVFDAF